MVEVKRGEIRGRRGSSERLTGLSATNPRARWDDVLLNGLKVLGMARDSLRQSDRASDHSSIQLLTISDPDLRLHEQRE